MCKQSATDSPLLLASAYICVPDESYIFDPLDSHDRQQSSIFFVTPEHDRLFHLTAKLFLGHIWLGVAICGDDPPINLRGIVDDLPDLLKISLFTFPDHLLGVFPVL
jgi:hypothetical protein